MSSVRIMGTVAPGYESVRDMFKRAFECGSEDKAQLCVYVEGQRVIDLWGTNSREDSDYTANSLQTVFSSTKSLAALSVACLVEKGLLDYDKKVSTYWPEFGQHGKNDITLADILRHEAGLPCLDQTLRLEDLLPESLKTNVIAKVIEKQKLRYPPTELGTNREYHAHTRGYILNEVFRRVEPKGRTIGEFLREEISKPLEADAYIGVQTNQLGSFADLSTWGLLNVLLRSCVPKFLGRNIEQNIWFFLKMIFDMIKQWLCGPQVPTRPPPFKGFANNPVTVGSTFNDARFRLSEVPSASGSCSARGLAKIAACIANGGQLDGVRIISEEALQKMHDRTTIKNMFMMMMSFATKFSQGGVNFYRPYDNEPETEANKFRDGFVGWIGFGGSVFQWHPEMKIGFAFVPTQMHWFDLLNTRGAKYQDEVMKCVRKFKKQH